jgi:Tfp pilus assembly protein PilX
MASVSSMRRRTIKAIRAEDGVVMVVVMGCLLVLGILSAGVLLTATATSKGGQVRSASDRALAAAQEGLQTAIYRLNTSAPDSAGNNQCVPSNSTSPPGAPPAGTQLCGPYTSSELFPGKTGNTRWTFWVSPVLGTTVNGSTVADTCTGTPVTSLVSSQQLNTRCVTAKGEALAPDGRVTGTRRVQARVVATYSLFPIPGIFGNECLGIGGNADSCAGSGGGGGTVYGAIGSNGQIDASIATWCCGYPPATTTPGDAYVGPSAPTPIYGRATPPGSTIRTPAPIPLPQMVTLFKDPGQPLRSSLQVAGGYTTNNPGGLDVAGYNDNATAGRITFGNNCQNNGNTSGYLAASRSLVVRPTGNATCIVTLGDGLYDFCSIDMSSGTSEIQVADTIAAKAEVKIFIDSPLRDVGTVPAGSPGVTGTKACPSGTNGNVTNKNGQANPFLANAPTSLAGQVYVYGDPSNPDNHHYYLTNGGQYSGLLFATHSFVSIKNNGDFFGGLAANKLSLQNGTAFRWDQQLSLVEGTKSRTYYRSQWTECRRDPAVATDPTSGC